MKEAASGEQDDRPVLLTLEDAAHTLGIPLKEMRRLVLSGQIVGTYRANGWLIGRVELEVYAHDQAAEQQRYHEEWQERNGGTVEKPGEAM